MSFYILTKKDENDLPVCEHCGSILAHLCDCQMGEEE